MQPGEQSKRKYTKLSGIRRKDNNYGEIQERNVQVNTLPPVGSFVVILEKYLLKDGYFLNKDRIREYYVAHSSYTNAYGCSYIYRVNSYSRGIENPLDDRNIIELVHYYGGKEESGCLVSQIKAKDVAIGILRLDIVENVSGGSFDVSNIDMKDRVAKVGVGT